MQSKFSEEGFSVIAVAIVILVVAVIGLAGWFVYDSTRYANSTNDQLNDRVANQTKPQDKNVESEKVINGSWTLRSRSDISNLPEATPASFKSYLGEALSNATSNDEQCSTELKISKISSVNIKGDSAYICIDNDQKEYVSAGGSGGWALAQDGVWVRVGANELPECTGENGAKVFEEFFAECYANGNFDTPIPNPNGSISQL